ncbi:hypothetical protein U9M48_039384 [Paspalum notatum var. saurae]|uniref:Uncharacterized protein n=1 Tax=Paspalum notatum var. saurae TaxID=547442 RepID=A0AAQ3XC01_PASNO
MRTGQACSENSLLVYAFLRRLGPSSSPRCSSSPSACGLCAPCVRWGSGTRSAQGPGRSRSSPRRVSSHRILCNQFKIYGCRLTFLCKRDVKLSRRDPPRRRQRPFSRHQPSGGGDPPPRQQAAAAGLLPNTNQAARPPLRHQGSGGAHLPCTRQRQPSSLPPDVPSPVQLRMQRADPFTRGSGVGVALPPVSNTALAAVALLPTLLDGPQQESLYTQDLVRWI